MGTGYLIDTNTLIEFQSGTLPRTVAIFISAVIDKEFNTSVINKIEVLGSKYVTTETVNFIDLATVFELDKDIVTATIQLRKTNRIKLPDAVIAATALVHGLTLITRNIKDFVSIGDLRLIDPYTL